MAGLNERFHQTIAEASGNRMLAALISALHGVTHPLAYIDTSPQLGRQSVIHHIAIVKAIRAKEEKAAASAMEDHLNYLGDKAITEKATKLIAANGSLDAEQLLNGIK